MYHSRTRLYYIHRRVPQYTRLRIRGGLWIDQLRRLLKLLEALRATLRCHLHGTPLSQWWNLFLYESRILLVSQKYNLKVLPIVNLEAAVSYDFIHQRLLN